MTRSSTAAPAPALLLLLLLLAGCGPTGTGPDDLRSLRLAAVNGVEVAPGGEVPLADGVRYGDSTCEARATDGLMSLSEERGTHHALLTLRLYCAGAAPVQATALSEGTYTREGSSARFAVPAPQGLALETATMDAAASSVSAAGKLRGTGAAFGGAAFDVPTAVPLALVFRSSP